MKDEEPKHCTKKKRSRRRRKPKSKGRVEPIDKHASKKQHDAPMTKRDLYFSLCCELVSIGHGTSAVARVTMLNWESEVVLDTFVQVPVPVTDFRDTGITADYVSSSNAQAMSFSKVRQTVDKILRGKILIGHNLQDVLTALGLTHPISDIRDTAHYGPFLYEEIDGTTGDRVVVERPIQELVCEFLHREVETPISPMERAIASLDLYKAQRRNWEELLVKQAREKENEQEHLSADYSRDRGALQQQNSGLPPSPLETRHPQPNGYGQPDTMYAPRPPSQAAMSSPNSSWFTLGRSRQALAQPQDVVAPQAALSPQAMQFLSYAQYDEASSAYDSSVYDDISTQYDASSTYGSSAHHESSSALSESYISESDLAQMSAPPAPAARSSSSWFRFGSRKNRYPDEQEHEPMTSVSEEPEDILPPLEQPVLGAEERNPPTAYEPPRYFASPETNSVRQSSSWFTFRRPKSPKLGRKNEEDDEKETSDQDTARGHDSVESAEGRNTLSSPRRGSTGSSGRHSSTGVPSRRNSGRQNVDEQNEQSESTSEKQSSSWFSFRRSVRSSSITKRRNSQESLTEEGPGSALFTDTTETDEDWLQEVVGPSDQMADDGFTAAWLTADSKRSEGDSEEASRPGPQRQREVTWVPRFMRSSKPPAIDAQSPAADAAVNSPTAQGSFDEQWLDGLVAPTPLEKTVLNPSFFSAGDGDSLEASMSAEGLGSPDVLFSRARLATESTIPTVASEIEEDEMEGFALDFAHGAEQNLSFLNI